MQLIVKCGIPDNYVYRLLLGTFVIIFSDSLWLSCTYDYVYKPGIKSGRGKVVGGVGILLYALMSSAVAATIIADSVENAAAVGAMFGMVVFATFNITTFGINANWEIPMGCIDTVYGTVSWAVLFAVQYSIL